MARILAVALNPAIDISCLSERIEPTHKVRTREQFHYPGGGGTNVARVIAALGGNAELAYMSGGLTGPLFETLLAKYGLQAHRFAIRGPIRIALVVREEETGREYRFVPEGPEINAHEIAPVIEFIERFDGDYIIASGSLPPGIYTEIYADMATAAARRGVRFVLDTSGKALQAALATSRVFLVKPSQRELEQLVGRKLNEDGIAAEAANIVARGAAQHVAVSMGSDGALLANSDGILRVPSISVKTVSTVGAGDSFVAAMVLWLSREHSIEESFRFGVAAGTAAVMNAGTELCRKQDVFALYKSMRSSARQA